MNTIFDKNTFKLVVIGLLTGICASFIGGGAEVLIIPLLMLFKVFDNYKTAIGTSLASLLLPIGIFAVYFYGKSKGNDGASLINWKYAIIISIAFTIGTLASYFTVQLNTVIIKLIFAGIIIAIGIFILIQHFLMKK